MATEKMTIADKQYLAKILFTREKLEQKLIAKKVGVSEKTISKWVNEFNWKSLRNRLLIGKEEVLNNFYNQLAELNETIENKEDGKRYADSKEADIMVKYSAAIRSLETELAIADLVESGIRFIKFIQSVEAPEKVMDIADLWNSFLQSEIKK
ncbi:MAG: DDE transposase family protein [Sphingobacteriales bacterium]|nr:MAG: DDE transposase family protein [Sphingobacteriales bacterium]